MTTRDSLGHSLTGADPESLERYETAIHQLQCYIGDPVASVDEALNTSPGFVMGHTLKAYLHLLGTEPDAIAVARDCYIGARTLPADDRERHHLEAVRHFVEGRWHAAGRTLERPIDRASARRARPPGRASARLFYRRCAHAARP